MEGRTKKEQIMIQFCLCAGIIIIQYLKYKKQ